MIYGLHARVPYATYASWPGLRASYLRHFRRSPLHARQEALRPRSPTAAMDLGSAIHTAVLEPERLELDYVRGLGVDRRSNANKAAWAEFEATHAGKGVLDWADWATVQAVRDSVWAQPWAQPLLSGQGSTELSVTWEDPDLGVGCKARIDRFAGAFGGTPTVCDLKSTRDASKASFLRDIEQYDYALQAAFYMDGLAAHAARFRQWYWIAVEKFPPYGCALYTPDDETLDEGRAQYKAAIAAHLAAERAGRWAGYPETAQLISLRPWARIYTRKAEEAGV